MQAILHHRDSVNAVPVEDIVSAVAQLVNDADLLLTSASLYVGSALLHSHPASASSVSSKMLPPALLLAQSTLLQVTYKGCIIASNFTKQAQPEEGSSNPACSPLFLLPIVARRLLISHFTLMCDVIVI